jgi:hypothetical protein
VQHVPCRKDGTPTIRGRMDRDLQSITLRSSMPSEGSRRRREDGTGRREGAPPIREGGWTSIGDGDLRSLSRTNAASAAAWGS